MTSAEGHPIVILVFLSRHAGLVVPESFTSTTPLGKHDICALPGLPPLRPTGEQGIREFGRQIVGTERAGKFFRVYAAGGIETVILGNGGQGA